MNSVFFTTAEEKRRTEACLAFAKRLGLIDDDSIEAMLKRCDAENKSRQKALEAGDTVYGVKRFSPNMYLDYELTRFKLDFASEKQGICYDYKPIDRSQLKSFFKLNKDLFTRYNGDKFRFKEVQDVIYKMIREEQYENEINDILR